VKRLVVIVLKATLSLGILAYLFLGAHRDGSFARLGAQHKDWATLALAAVACWSAVALTMVRWCYLVRAVGLPFTLKDAFRLGFLGYLFNLAPLGIVGGDLLKAGMLAWEHPGNKGKAVASVVVDRVIGLYILFAVAAVAIVAGRFWALPVPGVGWISAITLAIALFGGVALVAFVATASPERALAQWLCRLPRLGRHLENSIEALRCYRSRPAVLLGAAAATVLVHTLFATGLYCIYSGLRYQGISLGQHFVIMPLSTVTGLVPLSIGPFEIALEAFYRAVPLAAGFAAVKGQGLIVALGYRVITLMIAAVGVCYYLSSRREVASVIVEVEHEDQSAALPPAATEVAAPAQTDVPAADSL
jgi:glycosyltransferase 2 family protein